MSVNQLAKEAALLEFRKAVLQQIHEAGYVSKGSLASMFGVHRETMSRIVDWLIKEGLVRLVGSPVGCPYEAFGGGKGGGKTLFYTATKVDIKRRHPELAGGVLPFYVNTECLIMRGKPMPCRFFCAQRTDYSDPSGEWKIKKEWVPMHRAGTHLAAVFIASSARKIADVEAVTLTSERVLRAAENPTSPMSNGLFRVIRKGSPSFSCRIEFESYDMGSTRYRKYFEELKACEFPTLYIALDNFITRSLDRAARNRERIAVVTYGDEAGCQNAIEGLRNGLSWRPPQRFPNGSKAGFIQGNLPAPVPSTAPITPVCEANLAIKTSSQPGSIDLGTASLAEDSGPEIMAVEVVTTDLQPVSSEAVTP